MSEHQNQRPSEDGKKSKLEKLAEIRMDETLTNEQVKRLARKHSPWSDWLKNEFAQYWYWLGVLAMDIFLLMDVVERYHVRNAIGLAATLAAFVGAICAEYLLFVRIWPESDLRWTDKDD